MSLKVRKSVGGIQIDEGVYTAIVEKITEKKGDWGPYYIWNFKVKNAMIDGEEVDREVRLSALTSDILTPKSKMGKFVKACGIDLENEDETEIDLEDCVGQVVKATVEDDEKDDGAVYSKVIKLKAAKKSSRDDDEEKPKSKKSKEKDEDDDDEDRPAKKKEKDKKSEQKEQKKNKRESDDDDDDEDPVERKSKKKEKEEPKGKKSKKKDDDDDADDDDLFDFPKDSEDEDSSDSDDED